MSASGDCTVAYEPGEHLCEKSTRRGNSVWVFSWIQLVVSVMVLSLTQIALRKGTIAWGGGLHLLLWSLGWVLVGEGMRGLVCLTLLAEPLINAFWLLHLAYLHKQDSLRAVTEKQDQLLAFIHTFRPLPEVIDEKLRNLSAVVDQSCTKQASFLSGPVDLRLGPQDIEENIKKLREFRHEQEEFLAEEVKFVLAKFSDAWNLADQQGYSLKPSWKQYAGVAESKGVEGRNEPPGQ